MTRREEIIKEAAKEHFAHGWEGSLIDAFTQGALWADEHPNLTWEDIRKICLIAENVHKYYGFWTQSVYEEIFNKFIRDELS